MLYLVPDAVSYMLHRDGKALCFIGQPVSAKISTCLADPIRHLFKSTVPPGYQYDMQTLAGKLLCDRTTHPARSARDQGITCSSWIRSSLTHWLQSRWIDLQVFSISQPADRVSERLSERAW